MLEHTDVMFCLMWIMWYVHMMEQIAAQFVVDFFIQDVDFFIQDEVFEAGRYS